MNTKLLRTIAFPSVFLISTFALAGCAVKAGSPNSDENPGNTSSSSSAAVYSESDVSFVQRLIIHRTEVFDMGTLAETRALSSEVKDLAAKIKAEQSPEIAKMESWLKKTNIMPGMGPMGMNGMLSATEMKKLKNVSGSEFDRLYLEGMIGHYKSEVELAQTVIDSSNADVLAMAKAIVATQSPQINYMESLLTK